MARVWNKFILMILLIFLYFPNNCYQLSCKSELEICDNKNEENNNHIPIINNINNKKVNLSTKWSYVNRKNQTRHLNREKILSLQISDILSGNETNIETTYAGYSPDWNGNTADKEFISTLSGRIQLLTKPFDASRSPTASNECRQHSKLFLKAFYNFDLWALQLHDSSARLTSGILNGNINQFGDFDQCLRVQGPLTNLQGQYCLAYMQPSISEGTPYLRKLYNLVQSHGAFKSEFYDPGHRVPRFSLINWALCIPSSCTAQDVEYSLKEYMENLTARTGINFQVRVEPKMCQINDNNTLDRNTKIAGLFFLTIIGMCLISAIYEYNTERINQNQWLTAFSLLKNTKSLFSTNTSPGDISSVHGIRFINAIMLLISHKSMAMFFNPYINRTHMAEMLGQSWTVIGRAASIYTDPFLLFSGMLTAYSMFGRLKRGQSINLKSEYIGRFLRIVPTLGALILFCTYILPLLGSGPQWNLVVQHHSDICKKYWWRNLLFIHNYFGFGDMCLTHTHHLGIDTELFVFAPFMILTLWKWPRKGLALLLILAIIGTGARFYTTVVNRLSNYVYFGTTIRRLFKTADYMYSYPPHRSTVYILGVLLGYALQMCRDIKLSKLQLRWGWSISTLLFCSAFFGPAPMGHINYKYNPYHAANYAAFAPIAWCSLFAWIVFTSHLGYKNRLSNFLSWSGFQITTKLSYAIYLTQFPVFFYNVGRRRHTHYWNFIPLMVDTNEYICIFLASTTLTLLFDIPFQNIKKLLFNKNHVSNFRKLDATNNNNNNIDKISQQSVERNLFLMEKCKKEF